MTADDSQGEKHILVLGGVRSGKSVYAEKRVLESGLEPVYIATGQALDDEMKDRIALHRKRRDMEWHCVEAPLDLVGPLARADLPGNIILVDCLTMWLNNLMGNGQDIRSATGELLGLLPDLSCPVFFVSSETGLGIIPDNRLARRFGDEQGLLNQAVARSCGEVVLVAAGLPLTLKG